MKALTLGGKSDGEPLDAAELFFLSETWGLQLADAMICDPRWPICDQPNTIRDARRIVDRAIVLIVATLDESADFRPHTPLMAAAIRDAFEASLQH